MRSSQARSAFSENRDRVLGAQAMARLNLDDLQSRNGYSEIRAYNQTKLLNLLFTYELARRLQGTGVTANAVEPGFVKTNMRVPFPFSLF